MARRARTARVLGEPAVGTAAAGGRTACVTKGTGAAKTLPTLPLTGVVMGCDAAGFGGLVKRSEDVQTEAPTATAAGKRGTIRSTVRFTLSPAAWRWPSRTLFGRIREFLEGRSRAVSISSKAQP
jgi:hypothetical protein